MNRNKAIQHFKEMDTWKVFDTVREAANTMTSLATIGYTVFLFVVDSTIILWTNAPEHALDYLK